MNFLIKSNLFVALCTASLTAQTYILLDKKLDYLIITCVFFSTIFIYCFHRMVKYFKKKKNTLTLDLPIDQKTLLIVAIVSFLALVPIVLFLKSKTILFFFGFGVITIWYSLGFFRIQNLFINLRNIPFLKLFIIAFVWSMMTVFMPFLQFQKSMEFYFILIERFIFIIAITIPFDIRDIKIDTQEGLKTIPIVFGFERAKIINYCVVFAFVLIVLFSYFNGYHSMQFTVALLMSSLITFFMIVKTTTNKQAYFYSIGMEGLSLIQSIFVFVTLLF